jgi:hypothetical protein
METHPYKPLNHQEALLTVELLKTFMKKRPSIIKIGYIKDLL